MEIMIFRVRGRRNRLFGKTVCPVILRRFENDYAGPDDRSSPPPADGTCFKHRVRRRRPHGRPANKSNGLLAVNPKLIAPTSIPRVFAIFLCAIFPQATAAWAPGPCRSV